MKNLRAALKSANTADQIVVQDEQIEIDPNTAKNEVDLLKEIIVNPQNMDVIKEKLRLTVKYRSEMVKNKSTDLLQCFPYFFTNAELVSISNSFC